MSVKSWVLRITILLALAGCQTAATETRQAEVKRPEAARIMPKTVLPTDFKSTLDMPLTKLILVPVGMLSVSEVTRPRAELRSGPGAQFEVSDEVLPTGTPVMVFNLVGVWRKVVVMEDDQVLGVGVAPERLSDIPRRADIGLISHIDDLEVGETIEYARVARYARV